MGLTLTSSGLLFNPPRPTKAKDNRKTLKADFESI